MLTIASNVKRPMSKFTVAIGSKFTGKPVSYRNEGTGEFYEVFPRVDVKLQQALLKTTKG